MNNVSKSELVTLRDYNMNHLTVKLSD